MMMRQLMKQLLMVAGLVYVGLGLAYAAADLETKTVDKACYAEIFEDTDFDKDDPHVLIQGPSQIANLKEYNGRNWNNEIDSIIVGPNATMKVYSEKDFKGIELILPANKRVTELSVVNMSDEIESIKLTCGG
ncbi:hypothetical protein YTPLAS72_00460 [Nitrospira sp.]|nr:hypothetical protein YTPLAS72_00460 [Nitrospira sp.]